MVRRGSGRHGDHRPTERHGRAAPQLPRHSELADESTLCRAVHLESTARREAVKAQTPSTGRMRGRNAVLHSPHLFSGFLPCGICRGAITVVSGGYGSPRYGCQRASKEGKASCRNRLTIRAKVADAALLAGLRAFLVEPGTIEYLTTALSARLNAPIDERPRLHALRVTERETIHRKLQHLVCAIEDGSATPALLDAMRKREQELARLDMELTTLDEPLRDRLAVIPSWVRSQVDDVAGLLSGAPERAKREFQRLGVGFTVFPVSEGVERPFLRATGTTDFSKLLAGSGTDFTTTVPSDQRRSP